MHGTLTLANRPEPHGILFAEDFGDAAPDDASIEEIAPDHAEPEIIEPMFSEAELDAACQAARDAGAEEGRRQAEQASQQKIATALASIAEKLTDARHAVADMAAANAEHLARTVLAALSAALPRLCARHGAAEIQALVGILLPSLDEEPAVVIRVQPDMRADLQEYVGRIAPGKSGSIAVLADEALSHGDVRVEWRYGQARRDTRAILSEISAALNAQDLLDTATAGGEMTHAE
jgi:flagellar biosynthesis/type III secretory pathway protein FliH